MPDLFVVVDPSFGERLEALIRSAPIWVVATPDNEGAHKRLWKVHQHADHREKGAITCYRVSDPEDRVASLLNILFQMEQHHGPIENDCFSFPNKFVLEVIGLPASEAVAIGLGEYGFASFLRTPDGFQARVGS